MIRIDEGMRPGDLEDLILPMITVDEYRSKIDDDAIVIGFYVSDRDAAEDLNRFLQKSPIQMIDSEISPAPDQHGYYLVFFDLINDRAIVDNLAAVLEEVGPLCDTDQWQMRLRDTDGVMPFSKRVLTRRFAKMRGDENILDDDKENQVIEFLTDSDLDHALIEGNNLVLQGIGMTFRADIIDIGDADDLIITHSLTESALSLDLKHMAEALKMSRMLGEGWVYSKMGEMSILQRHDSSGALLLKNSTFR